MLLMLSIKRLTRIPNTDEGLFNSIQTLRADNVLSGYILWRRKLIFNGENECDLFYLLHKPVIQLRLIVYRAGFSKTIVRPLTPI